MPFSTTKVFHPHWSANVRPTNEDAFNVTITVTVPNPDDTGGWDPGTGPTPGTSTTLYSGAARITYRPTQGAEGDAAGQDISSRRAQVTIPRDQPVPDDTTFNDAQVTVTGVTDPNAPAALVGRILYVETVSWSSHTWELLLDAIDDQTNQGE